MPALTPESTPRPWWREPYVWMVIGGPLAVVVAGIATVVIAVRNPDPVLQERRTGSAAQLPAQKARNHAATPETGNTDVNRKSAD